MKLTDRQKQIAQLAFSAQRLAHNSTPRREVNADSNEEYVRERWLGVFVGDVTGTIYVGKNYDDKARPVGDSWQAAKDFTVNLERKIAEVEEELTLLYGWRHVLERTAVATRILLSREAALAELKKGMK